jgi:hypothetical protein
VSDQANGEVVPALEKLAAAVLLLRRIAGVRGRPGFFLGRDPILKLALDARRALLERPFLHLLKERDVGGELLRRLRHQQALLQQRWSARYQPLDLRQPHVLIFDRTDGCRRKARRIEAQQRRCAGDWLRSAALRHGGLRHNHVGSNRQRDHGSHRKVPVHPVHLHDLPFNEAITRWWQLPLPIGFDLFAWNATAVDSRRQVSR